MLGFRFTDYVPDPNQSTFDKLFKIFQELMLYTSGDVSESLSWLNELDREYKLTTDDYGMGDFIRDLEEKGRAQKVKNVVVGIALVRRMGGCDARRLRRPHG